MEPNKIKQLLEKYYDGNTSTEEDQLLKDYFRNESVPAEFEVDRQLFLYTASEADTLPLNSQLEQKLETWIDQQESKETKTRKIFWGYRIAGIAAMFAIVITCYLTFFQPKNRIAVKDMKDTYNNPELAYAEAKRALLFVSQQLNRGTEQLEQVSKLNTGMNKLSNMSALGDGFEQLELVSKYYNTSKTENDKTK